MLVHQVASITSIVPTTASDKVWVYVWSYSGSLCPALNNAERRSNTCGGWNSFDITTLIQDHKLCFQHPDLNHNHNPNNVPDFTIPAPDLWWSNFAQIMSFWQVSIAEQDSNASIVINRGFGYVSPIISNDYGKTWSVLDRNIYKLRYVRTLKVPNTSETYICTVDVRYPPIGSTNPGNRSTTWPLESAMERAFQFYIQNGTDKMFQRLKLIASGGGGTIPLQGYNGILEVSDLYNIYMDPSGNNIVLNGLGTNITPYNGCTLTLTDKQDPRRHVGSLLTLSPDRSLDLPPTADSWMFDCNVSDSLLVYDSLIVNDSLYISVRNGPTLAHADDFLESEQVEQTILTTTLKLITTVWNTVLQPITIGGSDPLSASSICTGSHNKPPPAVSGTTLPIDGGISNGPCPTNGGVPVVWGYASVSGSKSDSATGLPVCWSRCIPTLDQSSHTTGVFSDPMPFSRFPLRLLHDVIEDSNKFFVVYPNEIRQVVTAPTYEITTVKNMKLSTSEWEKQCFVGYGLHSTNGSKNFHLPICVSNLYASLSNPQARMQADWGDVYNPENSIELYENGRCRISNAANSNHIVYVDIFAPGGALPLGAEKTKQKMDSGAFGMFPPNGMWVLSKTSTSDTTPPIGLSTSELTLYYNTWNSPFNSSVPFDNNNPGFGKLCSNPGETQACISAYDKYCTSSIVQPTGNALSYNDPMCACSNSNAITNSFVSPSTPSRSRAELESVAPCVYGPCAKVYTTATNYTSKYIQKNECNRNIEICDNYVTAGGNINIGADSHVTTKSCNNQPGSGGGTDKPGGGNSPRRKAGGRGNPTHQNGNKGTSIALWVGCSVAAVLLIGFVITLSIKLSNRHRRQTNTVSSNSVELRPITEKTAFDTPRISNSKTL